MRRSLAALAVFVLPFAIPGIASAECGCVCNMGQAVGICSLPFEQPPICSRLCTQSLSQQITTPSVALTLSPGSVYGGGTPAGGAGADSAGAAAAAAAAGGAASAAALAGAVGSIGVGGSGGAGGASQSGGAAAAAAAGFR